MLIAVDGVNDLVPIDPAAMKIVGRYKLPGIENPHGIALDQANRLAFIAGEENHSLAVFDLNTMKLLTVHQVGEDPDVLVFDPGLGTPLRVSGIWRRFCIRRERPRSSADWAAVYASCSHGLGRSEIAPCVLSIRER